MSSLHKSWQVTLADLAMILFLVAASAAPAPEEQQSEITAPDPFVAGEPSAIFRDNGDNAQFARWLQERASDRRETLTIRGGPVGGRYEPVLSRSAALMQIASEQGVAARVVLEPEGAEALTAVFAFDLRSVVREGATANPAREQTLAMRNEAAGIAPERSRDRD